MNKNKVLKYRYNKILLLLIGIATLFIGIGYAALNSISLDISGSATAVKYEGLFISEVEFDESQNENIETLEELSTYETILNSRVTLSSGDADSYVSYIVTVYNNTNEDYYYTGTTFDEEFYDNEDIVYTVTRLSNTDLLKSKSSMAFEIIFEYKDSILSDNNILNSYIKFCFSKTHLIKYRNLAGNNLPSYVVENQDLNITFENNIPADVQIYSGDELITEYTYADNTLIVPNVTGEIKIEGYLPEPYLGDDLIPVIYDGSDWIAVDEDSEWYDYGKQEWANAIVPKTDVSISVGDKVDIENDIRGIFVWIPRFEYKISDEDASEIYINFLTPDTIYASTGYELPYAFLFDTTEVSGLWIGKFETGVDSDTEEICVLPNVLSLREKSVSELYNLGINYKNSLSTANFDSHMAKNNEWAVAAYLSNSLYGKFGNSDYSGANKEIYINNSIDLYTGRSGGSPTASATNSGTYNYDKGFVGNTEKSGIGASTTGNIYGIYDMNGGSYEYVMGYLTTASSTFGSTSYQQYNPSGFTFTPESKYYNGYTSSVSDSTPHEGHALGETAGWYDDASVEITGEAPWYMRGSVADKESEAGIFAYEVADGGGGAYATFRLVLAYTE